MQEQSIGPVEKLVGSNGPRRRNVPLASAPLALARYFIRKGLRKDPPAKASVLAAVSPRFSELLYPCLMCTFPVHHLNQDLPTILADCLQNLVICV